MREAGDVAARPRQALRRSPAPTGSASTTKTIGIDEVACLAASAVAAAGGDDDVRVSARPDPPRSLRSARHRPPAQR